MITLNGYEIKPYANLRGVNLSNAKLRGVNLSNANLRGVNLSNANLRGVNLRGVNLRGVNLIDANLRGVNLSNANLRGVNLSNANLSGANLRGVNLSDVVGIASKSEEMKEASRILKILKDSNNKLDMESWHTCNTTHCLAGWSEPNLDYPGATASRKLPTLTKYFFSSDGVAMEALIRVADGEESIYN